MPAIKKISTATVEANFHWTYVRIYADVNGGLYGTGECFFAPGLEQIIKELSEILTGEDFLNIGMLVQKMKWAASGAGSLGGIIWNAITGIEAALFDLKGKYYSLPVYELLGGKFRDNVQIYIDCHAEDSLGCLNTLLQPSIPVWLTEAVPGNVSKERVLVQAPARAAAMVELGYRALKFDLDIPGSVFDSATGYHLTHRDIDWMISLMESIRKSVGYEVGLAFDAHWRYQAHEIIEIAKACERLHVLWLEDPCPPDDEQGLKYLRSHSYASIGTGENLQLVKGFKRLIDENLADIITPDLQKAGGLLEGKKIADLAQSANKSIAPHMIGSPLALLASAHFSASISNFLVCEFHAHDVPFFAELIQDGINDWFQPGTVTPPSRPGFGIELNEKIISKYLHPNSKLFV